MNPNKINIQEYLPHRYPFLLVDRVQEISENGITAVKNVSFNEPYFQGHFPNEPIMPGVLIIESLAQASGVFAFVSNNKTPSDGYSVYLAGVDKSRFKRPVRPGDVLTLHAKISAVKLSLHKFDCEAYVGKDFVCSAILSCIFRKQDEQE